jgi:hypothetical protein
MVAGRTTGLDEIAPIRPPRPLGWDAVMLLLAGLMAVALALLGWWLWRRRRSPELPADRDLGPPPEVAALQGLWELEGEAWTAFGAERRHLDRLSGVIRTYLGERYHLPAGELTAAEIVAAGARRGYAPDRLARYAALIGAGDRRRYRPGPVPRHECRAQMESAVALLAEERAAQSVAPVAPQVQRAADQAWEALRRRYTQAADPAGGPECDPGGAGTGDPGGVAP